MRSSSFEIWSSECQEKRQVKVDVRYSCLFEEREKEVHSLVVIKDQVRATQVSLMKEFMTSTIPG